YSELPVRGEPGAELRVYSGTSGDITAPTRNHLPITMVEFKLEPGATVAQALPAHHNAFLYVLEGRGQFGADAKPAEAGQVVWVSRAAKEGPSELRVAAGDAPLRTMLWAGPPLGEPVVSYGPFVMNTMDEIRQAYLDYQAGKF
ncbi:MAG TPA: pirin-like C-terminal cupin domain-containing protein, partial [bacterium]